MQLFVENTEEYRQKVLHLLGVCQLLELALKLLIARKSQFEQSSSEKYITTESIYDEIKDFSLGLLIKRFKKIDGDKVLLLKLAEVQEIRDFLAHEGLLSCYKIVENFSQIVQKQKLTFDFLTFNQRLTETLTSIGLEAKKYPVSQTSQ